jgi:hypothetical protein
MIEDVKFDPQVVGLTLNIVGVFFILNSLVFKKPKRFLQDYFGIDKKRPLRDIRDHVLSQVQLMVGFVFLVSGYLLQIAYHLSNELLDRDQWLGDPNVLTIAGVLILSMLVVTLVLKVFQILWTKWTFRRLLTDFFRQYPERLSQDAQVAKEVGDVLGVVQQKEDSIADYLKRLHKFLDIEAAAPPSERETQQIRVRAASLRRDATQLVAPHPATPPRIGG